MSTRCYMPLGAMIFLVACRHSPVDPASPQASDTTSHEFIWTVDSIHFGFNRDIAVLGPQTVWVVGETRFTDSAGNYDSDAIALAKWNESSGWSYHKVPYHDWGSTQNYPGPLFAVFGFSPQDVYVCSYANLLHWNGVQWAERAFFMTEIPFLGQLKAMTGWSLPDLYCTGNNGSVFRYTQGSWKQLSTLVSGTIFDTHGSVTPSGFIALAVSGSSSPSEHRVLLIQGDSITNVTPAGVSSRFGGVWMSPSGRAFVSGADVFSRDFPSDSSWRREQLPGIGYFDDIGGVADNDIIVTADDGSVYHYNGSTWVVLNEISAQIDRPFVLDYAHGLVAIIAQSGPKNVLLIGRRP